MDIAIGLLKVYMKHGTISEMTLTPLFIYFFKSYPNLTLEQRIAIFIDVTCMDKPTDYFNTWVDLEFPTDDDGVPLLLSNT
jgi:hypothetical protein